MADDPARILVIEDDDSLRRACEATLRQRGFDTTGAADGEAGLRLAAREPHPDLILVDLLTPRLTGAEMVRELKADAATADIPVLALGNSSRDEDRRDAAALGALAYHAKANLSLKALAEEAEEIVRRRGGTR